MDANKVYQTTINERLSKNVVLFDTGSLHTCMIVQEGITIFGCNGMNN